VNLRFASYDLRVVRLARQMAGVGLVLLLLAAPNAIFAADAPADFQAANKLYAEGKFGEAAAMYEKIIGAGAVSGNLWFNAGNAEFKAGNTGKAITAYRRAALLVPRDPEVRANLDLVRRRLQEPSVRPRIFENWLGQLTLNEWTLFAALAFWATLLLLAAGRLRPSIATRWRLPLRAAACLLILSGAACAQQAHEHFSAKSAVVVLPESTVRSGPFDDAQTVFTVHNGTELAVQGDHGDWVQVVDSSGRTGWLSVKDIELVPDA